MAVEVLVEHTDLLSDALAYEIKTEYCTYRVSITLTQLLRDQSNEITLELYQGLIIVLDDAYGLLVIAL